MTGVIDVYDSANAKYLPSRVMDIASYFMPVDEGDMIRFRFIHCDNPKNSDDCGVYALANIVSLLHGIDPCTVYYDTNKMREHLFQCMENKKLTMFPHLQDEENIQLSGRVVHVLDKEIFCSCKTVEHGIYFSCTVCKQWFHPQCQGLGEMTQDQMKKKSVLKCIKCQSTRQTKKGKRKGR